MQKKQVAVLDIGSSKVTALIGEKGINNTFLIRDRKDFYYDGYLQTEFLDVKKFKEVLRSAVDFLFNIEQETSVIYVGVPGAFTKVLVKDSQISFSKKKKITALDIDSLFESAFSNPYKNYSLINRSAIVYELNDKRKLGNPIGQVSDVLKAKLSFVLCSDYFAEILNNTIYSYFNCKLEYVSIPLAEAMFLLNAETRDRVAILLDIGYISTTLSIIHGDGIIYQNSFDFGGGYLTGAISQKLEVDFDTAEEIKRSINLSRNINDSLDIFQGSNGEYYNSGLIRNVVYESLDLLCENISKSIEDSKFLIPDYVPIYITGGGIENIRGAKERIADRICNVVEVIAPNVPMMDKPSQSSVLSLLSLVLD